MIPMESIILDIMASLQTEDVKIPTAVEMHSLRQNSLNKFRYPVKLLGGVSHSHPDQGESPVEADTNIRDLSEIGSEPIALGCCEINVISAQSEPAAPVTRSK